MKLLKSSLNTFCAAALAIALGGCATIVGDKTQVVEIGSTPDGASIAITDERGVDVFKGTTPTNVTLEKSDGSYWGKKSYTVTITKQGFQPQTVQLTASANGWYIGGNLIFGGLIGYFIVDPMNGGMYTLSPKAVRSALTPMTAASKKAKDGDIFVMLLEDVPAELRSQMQRVN